ncbi:piggyBac transposable element-derived protein 4-like [Ixodes scapularis]|uniref:piggyBac transposable element-derived protein 4-like n=1 Tax=Ixodes scapularis TaxID=6945 RepID=UPI001A9D6179|nr:piggyBac transposable element-derived protein 4-like [Ixodes scapularis]
MELGSKSFYGRRRHDVVIEDIPSDDESGESTTDDETEIEEGDAEPSESESSQDSDDDLMACTTPTSSSAKRWVKKDYRPQLNACAEASGVQDSLKIDAQDKRPADVFLELVPEDFIEDIVFQTNLYATQTGKAFSPTNKEEIKTFLAINMLMGIKKLPSYRDFWSSRECLRDPFVSRQMSMRRFGALLTSIHLNDNAVAPNRGSPGFDKLYKVRPLLDKLAQTFFTNYFPSQNQSIDESMIRFKGRSALKQYMPMKPIKRGYKVWTRADETGYVCQFQIYAGKADNQSSEQGLGERVVRDLTECLKGKNYHVYFDNYFSSVPLVEHLTSVQIYATGTVRANRKQLPQLCTDAGLKRGDVDWRMCPDDKMLVLKWKDKRCVTMISNAHTPSEIKTVKRRLKDGAHEDVPCPQVIIDYNQHMGYVDKADMLKSYYEVDRKSKKWWHRIFFHFMDVSVVNAHILFKQIMAGERVPPLKEFKLQVAEGLMGAPDLNPHKKRKVELPSYKPHVPQDIRYNKVSHLPIHSTSRRCALCSTKDNPCRTRWMCEVCNVGLSLQGTRNCFLGFHRK